MAFYDIYLIGATGVTPVTTVLTSKASITDLGKDGNLLGSIASDTFIAGVSTITNTYQYMGIGTSGTVTGFIGRFAGLDYVFVIVNTVVAKGAVFTLVPASTTSGGSQWNLASAQRNCFVAGTGIDTPIGVRPVEALRAGDLVMVADGSARAIRWVGHAPVSQMFADPIKLLPIRIRAGALGEGMPRRDLLVSAGHAIYMNGLLIHAAAMVNGTSILRETDMPMVFTYHHIELDTHDLLMAEGAPAESFLQATTDIAEADWAADDLARRANLPEPGPRDQMDFPRVKAARQLPLVLRDMLAARAEAQIGQQFRAA